jgi:hypothetical protein
MLEKLMDEFIEERAKLINNLTIDLLNRINIHIDESYNNFDMLMVADEIKKKGYRLKVSSEGLHTIIALYKMEDLHDSLFYGYYLDIETDDKSVKLIAKEM